MKQERKEALESFGLATIGAIKGVGEEISHGFQTPEPSNSKSATLGWLALGAGVALFDRYSPETLTNRAHRAEHPLAAKLAIGTVALHLANILPEKFDPIHQVVKRTSWVKRA